MIYLKLKMNTQNKLQIARVLYQVVKAARACVGSKSNEVICNRSGLRWSLDLSEGIDLSIYVFGKFERATSRAIKNVLFPGAVVFDIGANVGAHALPMAKLVGKTGKVYAIEPTDWAFEKLSKNFKLNPELSSSLILKQMVFSDLKSDLPQKIYSSWKLEDGETHPIHGGHLNSMDKAESSSLDQEVQRLGLKKIDFIKLDVDGFELKVLKGGVQTLTTMKPKIILEITPYTLEEQGDSLGELLELLKKLNYRIYSEDGKTEISFDVEKLKQRLPAFGGMNVLASQN